MDVAIENNTATARRSSHGFVVITLESPVTRCKKGPVS